MTFTLDGAAGSRSQADRCRREPMHDLKDQPVELDETASKGSAPPLTQIEGATQTIPFALLAAAPNSDEPLASKYAPAYLLFPEATDKAVPPHPRGASDYHPRPVELLLDDAR